jgi:hypothetical protein
MFGFRPAPHLLRFTTPSSDSDMHLPFEELSIRSQESLPVSKEGRVVRSEKVKDPRRVMDGLAEWREATIDAQEVEIIQLKRRRARDAQKYREAEERIVELEHEIWKASEAHQETLKKQEQRFQEMAGRLTRTEELLAARSAELAGAQSFLSTNDRLSEAEVLDIVRDLNENIFQVAANLTEEWEKLGSSRASGFTMDKHDIDTFSQFFGCALIRPALNRDPAAVTLLVQSLLCYLATDITSSWRHDREAAILGPIYQRLSASGKSTSHAASEMRLTHLRGTSNLG